MQQVSRLTMFLVSGGEYGLGRIVHAASHQDAFKFYRIYLREKQGIQLGNGDMISVEESTLLEDPLGDIAEGVANRGKTYRKPVSEWDLVLMGRQSLDPYQDFVGAMQR